MEMGNVVDDSVSKGKSKERKQGMQKNELQVTRRYARNHRSNNP
jgi:hypothetical protein